MLGLDVGTLARGRRDLLQQDVDELIGCFESPGVTWDREPARVSDYDFRSDADRIAVPYGVYELLADTGTLFVGTSYGTPGFAVDCVDE